MTLILELLVPCFSAVLYLFVSLQELGLQAQKVLQAKVLSEKKLQNYIIYVLI